MRGSFGKGGSVPLLAMLMMSMAPLHSHGNTDPTICVGALFPGGEDAHSSAMQLAVERVVADPFILPGVTVKVNISTTNDLVEMSSAMDGMRRQGCVAVVGPRTSDQVGYLSVVAEKTNFPIVSYAATAAALTTTAPNVFSRVASNDESRALAILAFLKDRDYLRVGCVYSAGTFGTGLYLTLVNEATRFGVRVAAGFQIGQGNMTANFVAAREASVQIFIASINLQDVDALFAAANAGGYLDAGHVWITTDSVQELVQRPAASLVGQRRAGWLAAVPNVGADVASTDFKRTWQSLDATRYPGAGPGTTPSEMAMLVHDATMAILRAEHAVRFSAATSFVPALRAQSFVGATGDVTFTDSGNRAINTAIVNVRPAGNLETVSTVEHDTLTITQTAPISWLAGVEPQVSSSIAGRSFRAAIKVSAPFQIREVAEDGTVTWKGFMIDVMRHVEAELGCTFELVHVPDLSYNEMVRAVSEEKFDLAISDVTVTNSRVEIVRFSHATVQSALTIGVRKEVATESYFRFVEPFQGPVWICFLLSLVFGALIIYYLEFGVHESPIPDVRREGLWEAFWYCASSITFSQQNDLKSVGGRVFAWAFLFFLFLFTSFFTAQLTASLTVERLSNSINSPSDLVNVPTGIPAGTSTESYAQSIGLEKLVPLPNNIAMLEAVRDGSTVAFIDDIMLTRALLAGQCDVVTTGQPFYASLWGWPVSPRFEFLEDINRVLSAGWDSGFLTEELINAWVPTATCSSDVESSTEGLPLGDFAGLYIVLGVASVVSVAGTALHRQFGRKERAAGAVDPSAGIDRGDTSSSEDPALVPRKGGKNYLVDDADATRIDLRSSPSLGNSNSNNNNNNKNSSSNRINADSGIVSRSPRDGNGVRAVEHSDYESSEYGFDGAIPFDSASNSGETSLGRRDSAGLRRAEWGL